MFSISRSRAVFLSAFLALCAAGAGHAQTHQPPRDFSAIQKIELQNKLPGQAIPYFIRNDEGERHLVAGMALNIVARGEDTGGLYEAMTWTGGKDAGLPLHRFTQSHQALYVMEGQLELWLGAAHYRLSKGDYASIPPGTAFAFKMQSHRTKVFNWATGAGTVALMRGLGQPYTGYVEPEVAVTTIDPVLLRTSAGSGELTWLPTPAHSVAKPVTNAALPTTATPYVLAAGEGPRYVAGDQVYTYLGDVATSKGKFLAVMTEGPDGQMIPAHFHALHTEIFIPLEGTLTMRANQQTLIAEPGDIVHLPAGTIHAYQLNKHYTQFLGFLTPGVFDDFFRTLGDEYQPHVYPQKPGPLHFERILRKIDQLDLYLVDPPGGQPGQPGQAQH
jgi:quercetin 2,3-dioxygenase